MRFIFNRRWLWVLLISIFVILQLLLWQGIKAEREYRAETARFAALQQLSTLRARVEGLLNANLISMRGLRAEFLVSDEVTPERFAELNDRLLSDDLHTQHVAVAPGLVIRYIHPRPGNEDVIGTDYRTIPDQLPSVQAAISSGDIVITGPVNLLQGGQAIIARLPVVRDNGEVWGVISQVIDYSALLVDAGVADTSSLHIAVRNDRGELLAGAETSSAENALSTNVDLPDRQWQITATPKSGAWKPSLLAYWPVLLLGQVLIGAILALVAHALLSHYRLQQAFATISHQARFDTLTSLANRSYFKRQLHGWLTYCKRRGKKFALFFIDLDHFKEINDSLGHDAGDALLVEVARLLQRYTRADDILARLGGDEFVLLLKDVETSEQASAIAATLLQQLQEPVQVGSRTLHIKASIGIAMHPQDGSDVTTLLKHSDLAMYAAKNQGRGISAFFNPSMRAAADAALSMTEAIRTGLEKNQFYVVYQPIIDLASGRCEHMEALVRWQHPQYGLVPPDDFIPIAERSGLIKALGELVLTQACQDLHYLQQAGFAVKVAINRSTAEFSNLTSMQHWLDIIAAAGVRNDDIIFELTESILMPDQEAQRKLLYQLHQQGIEIAIDDFGTGYSSVNYLRQFPVAALKIDRSFIDQLDNDPKLHQMVTALSQMAQALHIKLIAEGVEKAEQAEILRALKVDYVQGYLYSKPLPLAEILAYLQRQQLKEGGVSQ